MKRSVTLADIARQLGVSERTVSQVLNGNTNSTSRVGEATALRVRELAEKWNYRPSASARAMQGNGLKQVGFVLEYDLHHGRMVPLIAMPAVLGISDYLTSRDWHVNIIREERGGAKAKALPRYLREHLVEGVILNSAVPEKDEVILRDLRRFRIPHVVLNGAAEYNSICLDDFSGITEGVRHLVSLGHKRIAYIGSNLASHHSVAVRRTAYSEAMTASGLSPLAWHYRTPNPPKDAAESAHEAAREAKAAEFFEFYKQSRPTALVCYSDMDALLASQILKENGVSIPEEISIVGYDDLPYVALHHPALTTFHSDFYQMGYEAAQMLLKLIKGSDEQIPSVIVEPKLIIRKSTQSPAR